MMAAFGTRRRLAGVARTLRDNSYRVGKCPPVSTSAHHARRDRDLDPGRDRRGARGKDARGAAPDEADQRAR
jgi:hypothetical protein